MKPNDVGPGRPCHAHRWLCIAALAGLASSGAHAALYGLSDNDNLYLINESTGAATLVVTVPRNVSLTGISFLRGTLYATDIFGDPSGFRFGTIDIATGAFTGINDQGGSANWHGLAGNESADVLYTIDIDDSDKLKSVTPGGVITTIGSGTGIDGRGMAYDNMHGILYATSSSGGGLYSVDVTTGVATLIGAMGISAGNIGLEYDEVSGVLYANDGLSTMSLYTVNTSTGAATLVGANGVDAINGLAWIADQAAIPEPATLTLMGVALAGLGFSRRRQ